MMFKPFAIPTFFLFVAALLPVSLRAQVTLPYNGVRDERPRLFAMENATLVQAPGSVLENATLLVRDGYIQAAGVGIAVPESAVRYDCRGQYLYPSFLELNTQYGVPDKQPLERESEDQALFTERKGPWAWNEALLPEFDAVRAFAADADKAKAYREAGFGAVLTHRRDGVARGSGTVVLLLEPGEEHRAVVRERAAAFYSFRKGSSTQDYPSSLMGVIALLRQTYLDGQWYARQPQPRQEVNLSLEAWNARLGLPAFFEAGDHYASLRAARIGQEFGVRYTLLGDGTEYRSLEQFVKLGLPLVLPLNFPQPYAVADPLDADLISYPDLLHWEYAPANAALLAGAGLELALTTEGLEKPADLFGALRKAMAHGLSEEAALAALTTVPARLAGVQAELGSLEPGKRANFLRCSGPIWQEGTQLLENWVDGERFVLQTPSREDRRGVYELELAGTAYRVVVGGKTLAPELSVQRGSDTLEAQVELDHDLLTLSFRDGEKQYRLSGWWLNGALSGTGQDHQGEWLSFSAPRRAEAPASSPDIAAAQAEPRRLDPAAIPQPFQAYGRTALPPVETAVFRGATVWTNTDRGVLEQTDVLIRDGRIVRVGEGLKVPPEAREIDARGMHLTPGIIDEHSHIAISRGVNEGSHASTAEVRIGDVVNPADVNIYRQLAGGVVASQLLHGSANPIGGQSALVKLRWGMDAEAMKIQGADGFIKFALGENVKQSNWGDQRTTRFPQTRMGVEQVYEDRFTRAREYGKRKAAGDPSLRPDLEMEALLEILEKKRFITCHSYVQSEINMLMKVAERFGFRVNTFTHILEGYKLADKMKAHGVGASSFADWWAYKYEVIDAIPHNAALLHRMGVVTALNSDDAEMARRLNTEAAKAVKYGGIAEQEALKMVTLNPAILLHLDHRMGTVEAGKDADLVLWSDHPLSIYSRAEQTWVDGRCQFSREEDARAREALTRERNRLILAMLESAGKGEATREPDYEPEHLYHCEDLHDEGGGTLRP
jgi:imidazolonepropionase-like amidohydrolase